MRKILGLCLVALFFVACASVGEAHVVKSVSKTHTHHSCSGHHHHRTVSKVRGSCAAASSCSGVGVRAVYVRSCPSCR